MIQLSFSAAQRYISSPMSFFLHYYLRLRPIELSSALVFGGAVDEALNDLLNAVKDGRMVDVSGAKRTFTEAFTLNGAVDMRIKGNVKFSKADLDWDLLENIIVPDNHDPAWYSLNIKGKLIIEAYAEQVLPRLEKVLLVQHEIKLDNPDGDTFIGIVDLVAQIDGKVLILDNKTSSIKYADDAADTSEQLGTYYEALKDEYNIDGVGYIVIPKNIRKKKIPLVPIEIKLGNINEDILDKTFEMYEDVLRGIKSGDFRCTGNCKKSFWGCTYQKYCASGGSDLTGLKIEEKKK
jgi:PD-(D/E)XK nuclease superfamily